MPNTKKEQNKMARKRHKNMATRGGNGRLGEEWTR